MTSSIQIPNSKRVFYDSDEEESDMIFGDLAFSPTSSTSSSTSPSRRSSFRRINREGSFEAAESVALQGKKVTFKADALVIEFQRYLVPPEEERQEKERIKKFASGKLRERLQKSVRRFW